MKRGALAVMVLALAFAAGAEVIVVREVPGAGLTRGDRLEVWQRAGESGPLDSIFDLSWLLTEQVERGPVRLVGRRGAEARTWTLSERGHFLPAIDARAQTVADEVIELASMAGRSESVAALDGLQQLEPRLAAAGGEELVLEAIWLVAEELAAAGCPAEALALGERAIAIGGSGRVRIEILRHAGWGWTKNDQPERAQGALEMARFLAEREGPTLIAIDVLDTLAQATLELGDPDAAGRIYDEILPLATTLAPASAFLADLLGAATGLELSRGDPEAAARLADRALEVRLALDPEGLEAANAWHQSGTVAWMRGDFDLADERLRRALEMRERIEPDSMRLAATLNNLSGVALGRGELAKAAEYGNRSLAVKQRIQVESPAIATSLSNLAGIDTLRGDLDAAEEKLRRAVDIRRRLAPDHPDLTYSLTNLAYIARVRGELDEAERLLRQELAISEKVFAEGPPLATSLGNMGELLRIRGRMEEAEPYFYRAWAINERTAPDSIAVATSRLYLSRVAEAQGDHIEALGWSLEALDIGLANAAGGSEEADFWINVAERYIDLGLHEAALPLARQGLEIHRRWAPGSSAVAEGAHVLARLFVALGRDEAADLAFCEAAAAIEAQSARLGGGAETRAAFAARQASLYRDWIEFLLARGREREAFEVDERSRARALLVMLAERDLVISDDLPPALEQRRRRLELRDDELQTRLADAELAAAERAGLDDELRTVRVERDRLRAEVRRLSPRLAALRDPLPLSLEGALLQLPPGELMLSYVLGDTCSHVFALGPDGEFAVAEIEAGEGEIRREVARLRAFLDPSAPAPMAQVRSAARALSRRLLGPVAAPLARAQRVVIAPAGALHLLPFAALADPGAGGEFRYLAERQPIRVIASATLDAELSAPRVGERGGVAAFGDPLIPAGRAALRTLRELPPLPAARAEIASLAESFPQAARWLGAEASERTAKTLSRSTAIAHFACHGVVDEVFPLDSALALAPSEGAGGRPENGFLQAWEIFESVRIDAELVVLSACETALGRDAKGEGILGLTRAFQYAGARSIVASLWSVADASTAELMGRFYRELAAGTDKAEALRRAQLALLSSADLGRAHPAYWAPFQLIGEGRSEIGRGMTARRRGDSRPGVIPSDPEAAEGE